MKLMITKFCDISSHNSSRDSLFDVNIVKISVYSKDIKAALLAIELKKDYKT